MPQVLTMSLKELLGNHNVKQIVNVRLGAEGEIKPKRWKCTKGNKKNGKLRLPSYSYIVPTYYPVLSFRESRGWTAVRS